MSLRLLVLAVAILVAASPGLLAHASDGGLAMAEGCAVQEELGFEFGPVVEPPYVRNTAAKNLFRQVGALYTIDAEHPYGNGALYFEIVYGMPVLPVAVGSDLYSPSDLQAMTTLERAEVARGMLEQEGVWSYTEAFLDDYNRIASRRAFDELATYCEWRKAVIAYSGGGAASGIDGYWDTLVEGNPNAAAYRGALDQSGVSRMSVPQLLTSTWAFLAVAGIQPHVSLPPPIPTNDFDPVNIANRFPPS